MKNIPLNKRSLKAVLSFLLAFVALSASAQVNISFTLRPPYSAYIKDYYHLENKAVIVLTNTTRTSLDIKLGGSITNESRGVYIRTNPHAQPPMPITLGPGATVVLTANPDVMRFFDQNSITTNANDAMLANIIKSGMLPEGNYQVCVNAYDYNTGKQLSGAGIGCFNFVLTQLDPPVITFPQNNHTYPADQKNLNFSWTPPLGNLSGALIEYDQIIVKVQAGQNPNDAIAAARDFNAGNPIINKRNSLSQNYVTQPYDLPFEKGQTYAMQVIARDRNQKTLMTNMGRSEIVTFQVGPSTLAPGNDLPLGEYNSPVFSNVQLKGKLRYYWLVGGNASNRNNFGTTVSSGSGGNQGGGGNNNNNGNGAQAQQNNNSQLAYLGNTAGFSGYQNSPLAGMTVQLIKATRFVNPVISGNAPGLLEGNILVGSAPTVLATATTTADGSFSFNVPGIDDINFGFSNTPITDGDGNDVMNWSITGMHHTVLMVKLASQSSGYYAHPIQYLTNIPSNKEMGTFYAQVRTFKLRVLVADNEDHSQTKDGMEVMVCRRTPRNNMVPKDEGSPGGFNNNLIYHDGLYDYEVIGKAISGANGEAVIDHIVLEACQAYGKTPYYILSRIANPNQTDQAIGHYDFDLRYATKAQWQPNSSCLNNGGHTINSDCAHGNCLNSLSLQRYSVQGGLGSSTEFYHIQGTYRVKPRVYAQVKNQAAGNTDDMAQNQPGARWYLWKISKAGMEKAKQVAYQGKWGELIKVGQKGGFDLIKNGLEVNGTPMVMERTGLTGADGRVNEELLPYEGYFNDPSGYYYILQVEKHGFENAYEPINKLSTWNSAEGGDMGILKPGMAFNAGEIWLKPKGKLTLRLKNERGDKAGAKVHYYDPATGVEGEIVNSTAASGGGYHTVSIDLPSGSNRKIVIHPFSNELYEKDTITVNIPVDEDVTKDVVIKYKLHRIYFNVKGKFGMLPVKALDHAKVELLLENSSAAEMYNGLSSPWISDGTYSNMPNQPIDLPNQNNNNNNQNQNNNGLQPNNNGVVNNIVSDNGLEFVGPYTKFTNNGGGVDFAFKNAGTSFTFRITGPNGTSYVVTDKEVNSIASKTWKRVDVELKQARIVKGRVTFGQVPVANARVRVKGSNPLIETFTNNNGECTMSGVPADTILTFSASKVGYQGMEFTEGQSSVQTTYGLVTYSTVWNSGSGTTTINFKLRIYEDLDLSRLLGFPLEVTELTENAQAPGRNESGVGRNSGGQRGGAGQRATNQNKSVKISGIVNVSDSLNTVFKMGGSTASGKRLSTIEFSDLMVVADDIKNDSLKPYCRPQSLPMQTDVNEQKIRVLGFYEATMYDNTKGVTLTNHTTGNVQQGVAQANVRIELTSFTSNSIGLDEGQSINLVSISVNNPTLFPVFTANGPSVVNTSQGIGIGNSEGNALNYRLHEFPAIAVKGTSRVYKDSLVLDTRLQTNLEHVQQPNLNLPIGSVRINKDRELDNINRVINHTTPLGTFSMLWQRIYINGAGVQFDGTLNAAGMNMPVDDAELYPTEFWIPQGSLQTNNVKLLNAVPVNVHTGATFGYDATRSVPAWYLSITSQSSTVAAADISGQHLSGLPANAVIPFTSIWFYSNNEQSVNLLSNQPAYKVHDIAPFTLQAVLLSNTLITLSGQLDPGIPAFPVYPTALLYEKTGANTISGMTLRPFSMNNIRVNGVEFAFNNNNSTSISFSSGQMQIKGRVSDENPAVFKNIAFTLTKTNQETKLVLDEAPQKQSVQLGGSNNSPIVLSNVEGRMWVENNQWNHLYITGDMPESMGFTADGKRMRFDVHGALSVTNQSVKLKKMETPFGNLNMTYDMENHRLMGNLEFSNKAGSMEIRGDAEIVVDRYGYYFMSGGAMEMSNPSVKGQAFLLFGNYKHKSSDRQSAIEDMLKDYSYYYDALRELPNGYLMMNELNGFFFEAGAEIPVPGVPNFDVNLGLVDAALEVTVGGDVRLGIAFGDNTTYNMGMGIFVHAYFRLGVTAIHACAGVEVDVKAGVDADGTYSTNGNYTLQLTGYIVLKGRVYAGGGLVCTSKCDGACVVTEAEGEIAFNAVGTITESDSSFRLEVRTGSSTFPKKDK